jgi:mevalonate kinase
MTIEETPTHQLNWKSYDYQGTQWFSAKLDLPSLLPLTTLGDSNVLKKLVALLENIQQMNPELLSGKNGYDIVTHLEFPADWGLGSSSTLLSNLAQWGRINGHELLQQTFEGSGYDLACAQSETPIIYQLVNGVPQVTKVNFDPLFKEALYFIHLNQKQNSFAAVAHYKKKAKSSELIQEISKFADFMLTSTDLKSFEIIINEHEQLVSEMLKVPTVKKTLFHDYFGSIKSLGAWGGDFILATGNEKTPDYFKKRGFETVIPYAEMVL